MGKIIKKIKMFFTFPLLILTVSTLLVYFIYKNKTDGKIEDMTIDILRLNEEKTSIEVKYNKVLSDMKKQEDLKRSKDLDEMQLLFTKVNMLDDKLTFFNTLFKNKLDAITSLLEHNVAKAESLLKTPTVDLNEQNSDEFKKFEENIINDIPNNNIMTEEIVDKNIANSFNQTSIDLNETNTNSVINEVLDDVITDENVVDDITNTPNMANGDNSQYNFVDDLQLDDVQDNEKTTSNSYNDVGEFNISNEPKDMDLTAEEILESPEILETDDETDDILIQDMNLDNITEPASHTPSITDFDNEQSTLKNQIESADTMYEKQERMDADIISKTVDITKNITIEEPQRDVVDNINTITDLNSIDEQIQPFDNSVAYDIDVLNTEFKNDNNPVNDDIVQNDTKNDVQTDIMSDDELNSALKELNDINLEPTEEVDTIDDDDNDITLPDIEKNNETAVVSTDDILDLEQALDIDGLDNVSKSVNMQNDIEKHEEDLKINSEPAMDGSIDNNNFDSIGEDFLNSTPADENTEQQINSSSGFNIKESIEKLKAQLDENKDENK